MEDKVSRWMVLWTAMGFMVIGLALGGAFGWATGLDYQCDHLYIKSVESKGAVSFQGTRVTEHWMDVVLFENRQARIYLSENAHKNIATTYQLLQKAGPVAQ